MLIKVCGVTTEADARMAVEAGATALGFNFYAKSPRYLDPNEASWVRSVDTLRVGVFVDADVDWVRSVAEQVGLDVVQIHRGALPRGLRVWQSVPVMGRAIGPCDAAAEAWVLDSPPLTPEMPGGTGQTYDWKLVRGLAGKIVIAGGLDGGNVGEAIREARPWGVDAASRLESAPGRKDAAKVAAFVSAARQAFAEVGR